MADVIYFKQAKADKLAETVMEVVQTERAIDKSMAIPDHIEEMARLVRQLDDDFHKQFPQGDDAA